MAGVTYVQGRTPTTILLRDTASGHVLHPARGVAGALARTQLRAADSAEYPPPRPQAGTSRRAIDPADLAKWADQPWVAHPTVGRGGGAPPALRVRSRQRLARARLRGAPEEKFVEEPTRVVESEPHPGAYHLLGPRDAETAEGKRFPGAPPVEFSELLAGPLGQPWPPLRYKAEFFSRYLPRGPSLQYLDVDPGPMYAISSARAVDAFGVHSREAPLVAPSLLGITRGMAGLAAETGAGASVGASAGASTSAEFVRGEGDGFAASASQLLQRSATAPPIVPSGAYKGSVEASFASSTQMLHSSSDRAWDIGRSVGQQFTGPAGAPLLVSPVGPTQAVVVALGAEGDSGLGGAGAAALNAGLMGRTRPGQAPTLAAQSLSGGAVFGEGASGLDGGSVAQIQTVIHPLDAFPATKRLVANEKSAQIDAEHLRRRVASNAVRRDMLVARRHPHGALGVDHIDNAESAVFGEVAASRRAERERMLSEAAYRESRLLGSTVSVARRGYDFLRPGSGPELLQTLRVEPASLPLGDARAARDDGVKFLQGHLRSAQEAMPHRRTERVVLSEGERATRDYYFQNTSTRVLGGAALSSDRPQRTALLTREGQRASYDIVTGGALPQPIAAALKGQ